MANPRYNMLVTMHIALEMQIIQFTHKLFSLRLMVHACCSADPADRDFVLVPFGNIDIKK